MTDKLKDWSTTPASNNQTPPNGWPENMAPSDVNNTARQDRASIREWYEDAQWLHYDDTATAYTSSTLTITGDVTANYVAGRKIRLDQDDSKIAKVESSSYSDPNTTVTVSGYTIAALPSIVELHIVSSQGNLPIIPPTVPFGYLSGCEISNNSTDSEHDIDIAAGVARDSSDGYTFEVSAITKRIDASWAEGDASGGFPSGLTISADTWYAVFLIGKTDGTVDAGFDTSTTATNLLADATGYTLYRRIGWVLTDGLSNIREFRQYGDWFTWSAPFEAATYTDSETSTDLTVGAPPNTVWRGIFSFTVSAGSTRHFLARPVGSTDVTPSSTNYTGRIEGVGTVGEEDSFPVEMITDSSSQIAVRLDVATNISTEAVMSFGWTDRRGV